ncbi:MAG TPA: arabinogalactan endo-1,4-beta-galactosidase [Povalibacter sp.]|nr:arabinogalactan endo-1,4-beta-galactosidase [Povalibacter sp.]
MNKICTALLALLCPLTLLCPLMLHAEETAAPPTVYLGADLSFVNEMEDCGGVLREQGKPRDAFELFREHGANLVRVRLWNDATWTRYSNLEDVKKTLRRARAAGMHTLLDFHYSDDWADGDKQIIPVAWENITDVDELAEALYRFTFDTLRALDREGLMPDWVQVGNETNGEILGRKDWDKNRPIQWERNAKLFQAGIRGVREAGRNASIQPRVMLHIAQPENVEPWFAAAIAHGVTDFDLIGISYYAKWSRESMASLGETIRRLRARYTADVVLVETAYPWTLDYADSMSNLLGEDSLIKAYPATPDGQKRYLVDLTQLVLDNGGIGVVYWEPTWISTRCSTRWGQGSGWENATFFNFRKRNEVLPAIDFMRHPYRR